MSERQEAFFRIGMAMGEQYELGKLMEALKQLDPHQLKRRIEEAIEAGESKVMITERGYLDISEVRGLRKKAKNNE